MRRALAVAVAMAFALVIIGAVVFGGGDTMLFVSPPEAVAEEFMRGVVAGRDREAMTHVERSSPISVAALRDYGARLRASGGPVDSVEGRPGLIRDGQATASATIGTERRGDVTVDLSLVQRSGVWRITGWHER